MPEPAVIIEVCVECEQDLEHCHGTAIVHFDGLVDCADDPGCRLTVEHHLSVVSCVELECLCAAPPAEAAWPGQAAAAS